MVEKKLKETACEEWEQNGEKREKDGREVREKDLRR